MRGGGRRGEEQGKGGGRDGGERSKGGGHGARLQHLLTGAIDAAELQQVLQDLGDRRQAAPVMRHRRLADLGNADTDHSWLWAVNPAHGFVLHPDDYTTAVRLRLGLNVAEYSGEEPCGECGMRLVAEDIGPHALLCAKGRRTVGHNRVRDHLADLVRASDSTVQTEVGWGVAVCDGDACVDARRPADILTSAAPLGGVGYVALDVGITTPHTAAAVARAGLDVLDEYYKAKQRKYENAAAAAKWQYRPVIISAFGRPLGRETPRLCGIAPRSAWAQLKDASHTKKRTKGARTIWPTAARPPGQTKFQSTHGGPAATLLGGKAYHRQREMTHTRTEHNR